MKILAIFIFIFSVMLHAGDSNSSATPTSEEALKEKNLKEQMEREKKYAQEQKFYQGEEYNLSEHQVDPKLVEKVPVIEPDYDFDITDVYRDDDENTTE